MSAQDEEPECGGRETPVASKRESSSKEIVRPGGDTSAPKPFLTCFEDASRPQTRLDRDLGGGLGVAIGRLRPDPLFGWRFVSLSHNTVRGAVLTAELLVEEGHVTAK